MRRIELKNRFLTRLASGAMAVSVVAGTTVTLGMVAHAQTSPPNVGTLTFTPAVGSDLIPITARTSGGCPAPDANNPDADHADSSQMFINGPDETTGAKTFPNDTPFAIVTTTSASFSNAGPFDLPFKFTLSDAAKRAQNDLFKGTGTLQKGTYHIIEKCISGFSQADFGDFTGTLFLTTPTIYQTSNPAANPKASLTTLTVTPPSPTNAGSAETLSATVNRPTDGSGNPASGSVQFKDGGTVLGVSPVGSNDVATLSQTLALGVHSLTATFNPDNTAQFSGSTSLTVTYAVVMSTTTTLTVDPPSPAAFGTKETLTATVTADSGTPAGSVQFTDGTANLGSGVSLSSHTATLALATALTPGTHNLKATFIPTDLNAFGRSSSSTLAYTVSPQGSPTPVPVVTPSPTPVPVVTPSPTPVPVVTPSPTPVPVMTPTPRPIPSSKATTTRLSQPIVRIPHFLCIFVGTALGTNVPDGDCSVLIARVAPSSAVGTVQLNDKFKGNVTDLSDAPVFPGGLVVLITKTFAKGVHSLTATFIPKDPATFKPSTSKTVRVEVR